MAGEYLSGTFTLYFKGSTNDGYGYPSAISGTVNPNAPITLPEHTPAREGYAFLKWTTNKNGTGSTYYPGFPYSPVEGENYLYAQWTLQTYTVTFNANGGTGAPAAQTKTHGTNLTLSSTQPTRSDYAFKGWGVSASTQAVSYVSGGVYAYNADITLYAVWSPLYERPNINTVTVFRSDASGSLSDDGAYFRTIFTWSTYNPVSSIQIGWKKASDKNYTYSTQNASGVGGTISVTLGGSLDPEYNYDVLISVSDSGGTTTYSDKVSARSYTIDVMPDGKGVALGKPASESNLLDVKWNTRIDGDLKINGTSFVRARRCVVGQQTSSTSKPWYRYASINFTQADRQRDIRISLKATYGFNTNTKYGIVNARLRLDTTGSVQYAGLEIETSTGLNPEHFALAYSGTNAELWVYINVGYTTCAFEVLSESDRLNHLSSAWVLHDVMSTGYADSITSSYDSIYAVSTGALNSFPIGHIVFRYDHKSPADLYGGTWTRIAPYFPYATSASGVIGETGYVSTTNSTSSSASFIKVSAWRRVS